MTQDTWILVGNASRARLFSVPPRAKRLTPLGVFEHAESRAHVRDLISDAQGRKPVGPVPASMVQGQGGAYGRPGAEEDTDVHGAEAEKFARELADVLEKGLNEHAYERLIIIAAPHFLGLLRSTVSAQVAKHIETTIDKDFTGLELPEMEKRVEHLRAA
jgi:protein required for attachment to host cells